MQRFTKKFIDPQMHLLTEFIQLSYPVFVKKRNLIIIHEIFTKNQWEGVTESLILTITPCHIIIETSYI
jgi:hypothetical protein